MTYTNANLLASSQRKRELSLHAKKRQRQRGFSQNSHRLIMSFGEKEFDGRGGVRFLMTGAAMKLLRHVLGSTQKVEALEGAYAVLSADETTVITVGHRIT